MILVLGSVKRKFWHKYSSRISLTKIKRLRRPRK